MSFDPITLAMARAYTNSQRIAYSEGESKTLTWDGDTTNVEDLIDVSAVKLTDDLVDLNTASSVTLKLFDGGTETLKKDQFLVVEEDGAQLLVFPDDERVLLISIPAEVEGVNGTGLYVHLHEPDIYRFESVTIGTEVIHPIDPKFLPGVCLPVVELETEIIPDGSNIELTEAEGNALTATVATGLPIVLKLRLGDQKLSAIAFRANDAEDESPMYLLQFSTIVVSIWLNGSHWEALGQTGA